ncbi:hypothetical protein [Streptomyces sp. PU-14G]|uniref:hypothetical protein n=1 Tax=Streptomyces sp. PU-14G TaxID=2800808 RepID=UPI0034DE293D
MSDQALSPSAARRLSSSPVELAAQGPESGARAGHRPESGDDLKAGPQSQHKDGVWSVVTPQVVLENTVTDPDGDDANLTFQVSETDSNGKPTDDVSINDGNKDGVRVSEMVPSGTTAKVEVEYGYLKPGVNYAFRTSAYDGGLYETEWSKWERFRIDPYVTFPEPQTSSSIDSTKQEPRQTVRTDPGTVLGARQTKEQTCSKVDAQGNKVCMSFTPASKQDRKALKSPRASASGDLVPWCMDKPLGEDHMTRTEACLRGAGNANIVFLSSDPDDPPLGVADFFIEQRIKAYPNKASGGGSKATFRQQLIATPLHIDSALNGVNLYWKPTVKCSSCTTTAPKWSSYSGGTDDGHWSPGESGINAAQIADISTTWTGSGKETIDLEWKVDATVDVGNAMTVTGDYGSSGDKNSRELAPRCDDLKNRMTPGCVLQGFDPTYTVDTNKVPAAGAYYWLMQQNMPGRPGSGDEPMHYLGKDTPVRNSQGEPWSRDDSRQKVCGTYIKPTTGIGEVDCDEFAMASTHESGGFPGSPNQVSNGDECAQLFADKMGTGDDFGLLADTRKAKNGPSWKESCGRAAIPSAENQAAFKKFPAPRWRMLDNDTFFLSMPGFEHCDAGKPCSWRKI